MAKSGNATAQGDAIKGDLGRVRRRSKDIEHDLNSLAEAAAEWNMLAGGRNRRNSKDYTDESLLEAFHEIDTDKSGSIEEAELEAAIRAMDPNASSAKIRDMLDFADADGDGQVTFEEFKKIMCYNPNSAAKKEGEPAAAEAAPEAPAAA